MLTVSRLAAVALCLAIGCTTSEDQEEVTESGQEVIDCRPVAFRSNQFEQIAMKLCDIKTSQGNAPPFHFYDARCRTGVAYWGYCPATGYSDWLDITRLQSCYANEYPYYPTLQSWGDCLTIGPNQIALLFSN